MRKPREKTFAHCRYCGSVLSSELRAARANAKEFAEFFERARASGFTQEQTEYMRACIGVAWAKAYRAGELAGKGPTS